MLRPACSRPVRTASTLRSLAEGSAVALLAILTAAGCGSDRDEPGTETLQSPICTTCAPPPVTPPSPNAVVWLDTSGEVGNSTTVSSGWSNLPEYTVQVKGLNAMPNMIALTELYSAPSSLEACQDVATVQTVYAYSPSLGYWYVLGPETVKSGKWTNVSGWFNFSYCDTRIARSIPSSVTSVIIHGKGINCWYGSCTPLQTTQGVNWHY